MSWQLGNIFVILFFKTSEFFGEILLLFKQLRPITSSKLLIDQQAHTSLTQKFSIAVGDKLYIDRVTDDKTLKMHCSKHPYNTSHIP